MGRQLERQDSEIEFQRYHPGCMWGFLHILDHHHLPSFRNRIPRRKHGGAKRAICCANPKTVSFDHFPEEVNGYLDAEAVPLMVEPECSLLGRLSGNSTVKALMAKEMSARPQLNGTSSIHHLEPSDDRFTARSASWSSPIIILHGSVDDSRDLFKQEHETSTAYPRFSEKSDELVKSSTKQDLLGTKQLDYMDVLEIFNVNKKLFMEDQEDPDTKMVIRQNSGDNSSLKKSGSFPASSNSSPVRPCTLEHKQKEVWYFPQEEKSSDEVQAPELFLAMASKDSYKNSQVSKGDTVEEAAYSHKHGLPHWRHSVTSRIKYIKRKIKHVLKESRKENHRRDRAGTELFAEAKNASETSEISPERAGMETSDDAPITVMQTNRRTSSLDESMERYTRLFESIIGKETKWSQYQSKSLRLTNDDKASRSDIGLKSFRRRLSLPDLDSFSPFPNEVCRDAFSSELLKRYDINAESENHNEFGSSSNSLCRQQVEPTDVFEDERPLEGVPENFGDDEGISETDEVCERVVETEKLKQRSKTVSGPDLSGEHMNTGESDCSDAADDSDDGFRNIATGECDESVNKMVEDHLLPFECNKQDDKDFSYVRDVLEVAGFTEQNCPGKWHSLDHPLSPTLFKELEVFLHGQSSSTDTGFGCHHRVLFDLINEELSDIYESSLAYFPEPFSSAKQRLKPPPTRSHLVKQVWKRVNTYQKSFTDEQSLVDIVGRDLEKQGGWMNILFDVEDVALDLEDMIFDQLLDELICS